MKRFWLLLPFLIIAGSVWAQDFPIGRTMAEVREFRSTPPHSANIISQSDTVDVYELGTLIHENYYYKNDTCYKSQQIEALMPYITMAESIKLDKMILDTKWKRVSENLWTNIAKNEEIELKVDNDGIHTITEIRSIPIQNKQ